MSKKGKAQTKSVEVMLTNFHADFQSGLNISQIAEKYDVGKSYAYKLLGKIAEMNGVSRAYYLEREHSTHNVTVEYDRNNGYTHYTDEMFKNIMKSFDDLLEDITVLSKDLEVLNQEIKNNDYEECQL